MPCQYGLTAVSRKPYMLRKIVCQSAVMGVCFAPMLCVLFLSAWDLRESSWDFTAVLINPMRFLRLCLASAFLKVSPYANGSFSIQQCKHISLSFARRGG